MFDYVTLDFETTGFSPDTSDIIEIGAWKIKDGAVVDKFCTLVRPIMYIPRTVQELTGITMDDVADCETIEPVLIEFNDWVGDLPFLGHNLPFEVSFLRTKGKAVGIDFLQRGTRQGIDTLKLCKKYMNYESNKLKNVAQKMGISVDSTNGSFHRAGYDAYITKLVYDRFLFQYPKVFEITTPQPLSINESKYGKVVNNATLDFS